MSRIALLCSILEPGGVGNDVFGMHDCLTSAGHEVKLFADVWSRCPYPVTRYQELKSWVEGQPGSILIYHFMIGWDPGLQFLKTLRCKKIVKYHNVTPPEFFAPYNRDYAEQCRRGREQIPLIARAGADLYLADSAYNAAELAEQGTASMVVAPFHQVDLLVAAEPDAETVRQFGSDGFINVLTVGRVVPNKGHELLLQAFAEYHHNCQVNSRLLIVGVRDPGLAAYDRRLKSLMSTLGIDDCVHFISSATEARLKALYQVATAFVITSEHEGFCVPLVEAMALSVPIIALASTAVTATVGDAGLVWIEREPALLAESMAELAENGASSAALVTKGLDRFRRLFANEVIAVQLRLALDSLSRVSSGGGQS